MSILILFLQLGKLIRIYNIRPEDIYNLDEKGFMMGQCQKVKAITRRGRKNPHLTHDAKRTLVTVIETVKAAGPPRALPPMVIHKGTAHYRGWLKHVSEELVATFAYSKKGWTDRVLGLEYMQQNFEPYAPPSYVPVLLVFLLLIAAGGRVQSAC